MARARSAPEKPIPYISNIYHHVNTIVSFYTIYGPIKPAALNKTMPIEITSKSKAIFNVKCIGHDFGINKVMAVYNFNNGTEDFEIGCYIIMDVRDATLDSLHSQIVPKVERFTHNNGQLFRDSNGRNNVIKG